MWAYVVGWGLGWGNMKRGSLLLLLLLAFTNVAAGQQLGRELVESWRARQRPISDRASNVDRALHLMEIARYNFYVMGVVDTLPPYTMFCPESTVTRAQILDVVGRYLEAHPEQHHHAAWLLIIGALKEAFPCAPPADPCASWQRPVGLDYEAIARDRISGHSNPYWETLEEQHKQCDPVDFQEYEKKVKEAQSKLRSQQ